MNDLVDSSRDWRSSFNQDMNRRFRKSSSPACCDLLDRDLQRKINRKNKLALIQMREKLHVKS
jgi:hypothetical protein